jgi:hypothetical protein
MSRSGKALVLLIACVGATSTGHLGAQGAPRPGIDPGPWDNDVYLYRAFPDGAAERIAVFERAGVPSLIRLADGRLMAAHQWFPENDDAAFDKVAVRFSTDDGATWTAPRAIDLAGLPEGYRSPFDPTLLQLPDGRIRLYFTTNTARTFQQAIPWIASAVSMDGVSFVFEPGVRLAVAGEMVIDCAAVLHRGVFHLYSPVQTGLGSAYHATSRDGLAFTRESDVTLPGVRWLGAATSDGARLRFYGTSDQGIWTAASVDGASAWSPLERIRVQGADPGIVEENDGSRFVLVTGPPRPGTPSAKRTSLRGPVPFR